MDAINVSGSYRMLGVQAEGALCDFTRFNRLGRRKSRGNASVSRMELFCT